MASMQPLWIMVGLGILAVLFIMSFLARLYRKAGPHEALVVYGFRGTRVIKGHGTIIFPMFENCRGLSLELMSFDVAPQQDLYTKQGVAVTVEAVAQIKVKSDTESILTASEQFLTKSPPEREGLIRLVMEGHLRGIIGQLTVEEIVKQPEMVADRMRSTCADDMNKMGLEVISFTIKEVRDKNEYITNMGRPDVARIKRDADVANAEAERDTAIKRANAGREAAIAKAQADQERVLAETLSMAKQAEAQRDLEIKKAQYQESMKKQQAQADKAYDIQANVMQQQVIAEQVKVQQVEKEQQVKVQEAEIARREKELIATVLKQAEIERQRIETLAAAEKQRLVAEAEGHASSIRAQGEAEAEIIYKKGEAEAKGHERQGRGLPGVQPGRGGGQADHRDARNGARARQPAGQRGQDHHRLHRQRRQCRHEQDHRRHRQDGGAGARAIRDALRHECRRVALARARHRRQATRFPAHAARRRSGGQG